jgi:hypothetical protein
MTMEEGRKENSAGFRNHLHLLSSNSACLTVSLICNYIVDFLSRNEVVTSLFMSVLHLIVINHVQIHAEGYKRYKMCKTYLNTSYNISSNMIGPISGLSSNDTNSL